MPAVQATRQGSPDCSDQPAPPAPAQRHRIPLPRTTEIRPSMSWKQEIECDFVKLLLVGQSGHAGSSLGGRRMPFVSHGLNDFQTYRAVVALNIANLNPQCMAAMVEIGFTAEQVRSAIMA